MYLLTKDTIEGWWPIASPLLEKAWASTCIGDSYSLQHIRERLANGSDYCFISECRKYAGVFSLYETPVSSFLRFYLSGGEQPDCGWAKVDEFLVQVAKAFECKFIQNEGRLGWKRVSEPLGYKVDSLIMTKEVT